MIKIIIIIITPEKIIKCIKKSPNKIKNKDEKIKSITDQFNNPENGSEGIRLIRVDQRGLKWIRVDWSVLEWMGMDWNESECIKMDCNGIEWIVKDQNG